jgi:hypothetical protein
MYSSLIIIEMLKSISDSETASIDTSYKAIIKSQEPASSFASKQNYSPFCATGGCACGEPYMPHACNLLVLKLKIEAVLVLLLQVVIVPTHPCYTGLQACLTLLLDIIVHLELQVGCP